MADQYSGKLQIWEGWSTSVLEGLPMTAPAPPAPRSPDTGPGLTQLVVSEALGPASALLEGGLEPYSLQWFLDLEALRHTRYARWLPSVLEFTKHAGERLLAWGPGLGTDWIQYARHGATVIACSPDSHQLALLRRNFELRDLHGRFYQASPRYLPAETATIDVVSFNGLHLADYELPVLIEEVYRILKPGGKVLAVLPAHFTLEYWARFLLPWRRWFQRATPHNQPAATYSARVLKTLFARFTEHRVHKRHLRRADLPQVWRWMPRALMERLLGRVLILKAFKPLSVALPPSLPAVAA